MHCVIQCTPWDNLLCDPLGCNLPITVRYMADFIAVVVLIKSVIETVGKVVTEKVLGGIFDRAMPADVKLPETMVSQNPNSLDNYAKEVGGRIRFIRECLGFSKRQMCEKLDIKTVTLLEKYESGEKEIPIAITRAIEQKYRINPGYLDGKISAVFSNFSIDKDVMVDYIRQGFTPVIVTEPKFSEGRGELYCYLTFEKHHSDFVEHAVGSLLCSFMSSGGGRLNIQTLIDAMLDLGMSYNDAKVLMTTISGWDAIRADRYASETSGRIGRAWDFDCAEIWQNWYEETKESRKRWGVGLQYVDGNTILRKGESDLPSVDQ